MQSAMWHEEHEKTDGSTPHAGINESMKSHSTPPPAAATPPPSSSSHAKKHPASPASSPSTSHRCEKAARTDAAHTSPSTGVNRALFEHRTVAMDGGGGAGGAGGVDVPLHRPIPSRPAAPAPAAVAPAPRLPPAPVAVLSSDAAAASPPPHASAPAPSAAPGAAAGGASQMTHAQQRQLRQLQSLESISSFFHCNFVECRAIIDDFVLKKQLLIEQSLELADTLGKKPLLFRMPQFEPIQNHYNYHTDIPGTVWQMPTPPGFYLPAELRFGQNCREHRDTLASMLAAKAASDAPSSSAAAAASAVDSGPAASSSAAALAASSGVDRSLPLFVLEKLLELDLQQSMEACGVLNSWEEGSHLSIVRTDGDGNCLCHAVLTALYGCPDPDGALRDCISWSMNSDAHRQLYLERFIAEQAREIGSARVLDEQKAGSAGAVSVDGTPVAADLDESDRANLTREYEAAVQRINSTRNYLDAIHVFALANIIRRPIIVYGQPVVQGDSGGASTPSSSASTSQQLNSMVGIYLPLLWPEQIKLSEPTALERNPMLKPICLLYSCDEQGGNGHFMALVPTQAMWPEPSLVPLQQWATTPSSQATTPSHAAAASTLSAFPDPLTSWPRFGQPSLPLLPIRFLLPTETQPAMQYHLLNKHLEVVTTCRGHLYAKAAISRTQNYLKTGWQTYLVAATQIFTSLQSGSIDASPTPLDDDLQQSAALATTAQAIPVTSVRSPMSVGFSPMVSQSDDDESFASDELDDELEPLLPSAPVLSATLGAILEREKLTHAELPLVASFAASELNADLQSIRSLFVPTLPSEQAAPLRQSYQRLFDVCQLWLTLKQYYEQQPIVINSGRSTLDPARAMQLAHEANMQHCADVLRWMQMQGIRDAKLPSAFAPPHPLQPPAQPQPHPGGGLPRLVPVTSAPRPVPAITVSTQPAPAHATQHSPGARVVARVVEPPQPPQQPQQSDSSPPPLEPDDSTQSCGQQASIPEDDEPQSEDNHSEQQLLEHAIQLSLADAAGASHQ